MFVHVWLLCRSVFQSLVSGDSTRPYCIGIRHWVFISDRPLSLIAVVLKSDLMLRRGRKMKMMHTVFRSEQEQWEEVEAVEISSHT
jgi:hypothetical protein